MKVFIAIGGTQREAVQYMRENRRDGWTNIPMGLFKCPELLRGFHDAHVEIVHVGTFWDVLTNPTQQWILESMCLPDENDVDWASIRADLAQSREEERRKRDRSAAMYREVGLTLDAVLDGNDDRDAIMSALDDLHDAAVQPEPFTEDWQDKSRHRNDETVITRMRRHFPE